MSLAAKIQQQKQKQAREARMAQGQSAFNNRHIAQQIMKARRKNETAFPSDDIESLVQIAYKIVAENFEMYAELPGVEDEATLKEIIKKVDIDLPITVTAKTIDYEFYWQEKCEKMAKAIKKDCKKEDHGGSYKQAFIERRIQTLLENHKSDQGLPELVKELDAARYEVFCLKVSQLISPQHLNMDIVFKYLPNLTFLTLTYGAKHVGMEYERPLFGMKMSDAKNFSLCLPSTQSLTYLSLPGNLIDDDLISILIKGLMLNKTITQLDLSHNKISNSGARKIAKYVLQTKILTHLNLGDNMIQYEGSRYLAQALKVNKSLISLNLKLNRLDDKAGSKLCIDLLNNHSELQEVSLSSNLLSNMFCESLAEFLRVNKSIKKLDISCNFIDESNAATLKDSLEFNENIIEIDVRKNQFQPETEAEINEIVTRNYLKSKSIPYKKIGPQLKSKVIGAPDEDTENIQAQNANQNQNAQKSEANSPSKINDNNGGSALVTDEAK